MKRRTFTAGFKRSAVALILEQNYSRQQAAHNLDIGGSTLDNWLHQHRRTNGAAYADEQVDLKKRNTELKRVVRQLTMERDILKKRRRTLRRTSCEVRMDFGTSKRV